MGVLLNKKIFSCVFLGLFLGFSACTTYAPSAPYLRMDDRLSYAGFIAHPANTTARYAMMNTLPPGQLTYRPSTSGRIFVYADPVGCGCVYMGSEAAYEAIKQNEIERRRAFEEAQKLKKTKKKFVSVVPGLVWMEAENRRDTAWWDWSAWSADADPAGKQPRHVIGGFW